jgi:hypothetical protein
MYFIIILTIEINNDNNKNDIVWLILSYFIMGTLSNASSISGILQVLKRL